MFPLIIALLFDRYGVCRKVYDVVKKKKLTILCQTTTFCIESSSTLLVLIQKGLQKVVRYDSLFWYYSQLLTMKRQITAFHTVLCCPETYLDIQYMVIHMTLYDNLNDMTSYVDLYDTLLYLTIYMTLYDP